MKYITLTVIYPVRHPVHIRADLILAVEQNTINENSQGSIVHVGNTVFQVRQEPGDILCQIEPPDMGQP
jgi:hypothetical protein